MFLPKYGINEDHVSGSAFTAVAEYWQQRLMLAPGQIMVGHQDSERGGKVIVRVEGDRVILGGNCVSVKSGIITV